MKNYQDVVTERFDNESDQDVDDSIYSESHPIGKYSRKVFFQELHNVIDWYSKKEKDLGSIKLLDIGCGSGETLSFSLQMVFQKTI